jgi:hypothetical protein
MQRYSIKSNNLRISFDLCAVEQLFFLFIFFYLFRFYWVLLCDLENLVVWHPIKDMHLFGRTFTLWIFHHLQIFYSS